MIKLTVAYPSTQGARFDHDYYREKHCPLAHGLLGSERYEIDRGLSGAVPGSPPPFEAVAHFYFASLDAFQNGMAGGGAELGADIPNYTDITPTIQVSEVVAS